MYHFLKSLFTHAMNGCVFWMIAVNSWRLLDHWCRFLESCISIGRDRAVAQIRLGDTWQMDKAADSNAKILCV